MRRWYCPQPSKLRLYWNYGSEGGQVSRRGLCVEGPKGEVESFSMMLPPHLHNEKETSTTKAVPGMTAISERHFKAAKHSKSSSSTTPSLTIHHFMDAEPNQRKISSNSYAPRHGLAAPSGSSSSASRFDDTLDILGPRSLPPISPTPSYQPTITSYTSSASSSLTTTRPSSLRSTLPDTFGFRNNGNSCYINSALQAILSLTPFISDLGSTSLSDRVDDIGLESLYRALLSVVDRTWQEKRKKTMDPSRVKFAFARVHELFRNSYQQDAHEFFGQVLQQLEFEFMPFLNDARRVQLQDLKRTKRNQKKRRRVNRSRTLDEDASTDSEESAAESADDDVPYSQRATLLCPVKRNFTGVVRSIYSCLNCSDKSLSPEVVHFLQLDVFKNTDEMVEHHISNLKGASDQPIEDEQALRDKLELKYTCPPSIETLLDLYFCEETVERKCEKCGHKVSRLRRGFVQIPRVLVIQIKRFRYDYKTGTSHKLDYPIEASETFSLGKWCLRNVVSGPIPFEPNLDEVLEASAKRFRKLEGEEDELKQTLQERREIAAAKRLAARPTISTSLSVRPSNPSKSALQGSSVMSSMNTSSTRVTLGSAKVAPGAWEKRASGLHDERSSDYTDTLQSALIDDEVEDLLNELAPTAKRAKVKEIEIESESVVILSPPIDDDVTLEIDIPSTSYKPRIDTDSLFDDDNLYGSDLPSAFPADFDARQPPTRNGGLKGGAPPKAVHYEEDEESDSLPPSFDGMNPMERRMWQQAAVALKAGKSDRLDEIEQTPLPVLELSMRSEPPTPTISASLSTTTSTLTTTSTAPPPKPRPSETIDLEDDDMAQALLTSAREQKAYEENEAALKRLMSAEVEVEVEKPKPKRNPYDLDGAFEGIGDVQSVLHARNDYEEDQVAPYVDYFKSSPPGTVTDDPPRPPTSYEYGLQAVIHHVGTTANSGHYVADARSSAATLSFIKPPAKESDSSPPKIKPWLHFDDTSVSESSSDGVLKPGTTPYLLFYVHSKVSC